MGTRHATVLGGAAVLSADGSDGSMVHGVAIGENDETRGMSGKELLWPRQTLRKAVDELNGVPITRDHPGVERGPDGLSVDAQPPIESVVGTVTNTSYQSGVGVVYEAEIYDSELREQIENGLAEVSPVVMGLRTETDSDGTERVIGLSGIRDLGIVARGASESNSIAPGKATAMSAEALSAAFGGAGRTAALSADEQHRVEVLQKQIQLWDGRGIDDHVDELRSELTELIGQTQSRS